MIQPLLKIKIKDDSEIGNTTILINEANVCSISPILDKEGKPTGDSWIGLASGVKYHMIYPPYDDWENDTFVR